jgi:HSP90 family molecular chaperone
MTREQLLSNLGTIASSGTRKFMEAMKDQKNAGDNLIGQVRLHGMNDGKNQKQLLEP